jgi:GLPGLI family protein
LYQKKHKHMIHLSKTLLGAALIAFSGFAAQAQDKNAGVIDYEVSAKMGPRGGNADGDAEEQVITFNQHFLFTSGKGKLNTDRPDFGGRPPQGPPPGGMRGGGMRGGFGRGDAYADLTGKKYLQTFTQPDDTTKTYYVEEDYAAPKDVKLADKTKKIAGYNCKKATVTLRDETYTVWYTQDLPFSYSPINGLLPEASGVVLAAESDRRSFTAKKVDLKPVAATDVSLPANAEKVTQDQRREMMQKFRGQQNNRN